MQAAEINAALNVMLRSRRRRRREARQAWRQHIGDGRYVKGSRNAARQVVRVAGRCAYGGRQICVAKGRRGGGGVRAAVAR